MGDLYKSGDPYFEHAEADENWGDGYDIEGEPKESEKKIIGNQEFEFTPETFSAVLDNYRQSLVKEIQKYERMLSQAPEDWEPSHYREMGQKSLELYKREKDYFDRADPVTVFDMLQKLFNRAKELEDRGSSSEQICKSLLTEYAAECSVLNNLMEHNLGKAWGYDLAQKLIASSVELPDDPIDFKKISGYFGFTGEITKEATKTILRSAYDLLNSVSAEHSEKMDVEIEGKKYFLYYTITPLKSGLIWGRVGLYSENPPQKIKNNSAFNQGEVAMTRIIFNFKECRISGEFATSADYEGQGFGTALLFIREGIIKDIMKRYADRVPASGLSSEIKDNSRSQSVIKNHDGLTSFLAQRMGYKSAGDKKFTKYYKRLE